MKKLFFIPILVLFFSCGGTDPAADAKAVCDCFSKANGLPDEDPKRLEEQDKCSKMQLDKWTRYKNAEEQKKFNDALAECSDALIRQALDEQ